MESISLWGTIYALSQGAKLLGAEDQGDLVCFTLSDDARPYLRAYELGKCVCNLRDAQRAHREVTTAIKVARGQSTWRT
jgi:hypothetical protein